MGNITSKPLETAKTVMNHYESIQVENNSTEDDHSDTRYSAHEPQEKEKTQTYSDAPTLSSTIESNASMELQSSDSANSTTHTQAGSSPNSGAQTDVTSPSEDVSTMSYPFQKSATLHREQASTPLPSDKGNRLQQEPTSTETEERPRQVGGKMSEAVSERKHRAFWELVQRILTENDVVQMIGLVLEYLEHHVHASSSAVFFLDQQTKVMSRVARGKSAASGMDVGRGLVSLALESKEPELYADFASYDQYEEEVDLEQTFAGQKLYCVPLTESDVVYAVVEATTSQPTLAELDHLDMKLLTWLGPVLSACMRKCIEYHDVLLSERTQKALLHIISSSESDDTVVKLVDGVIAGASHITRADRLELFMVDWETNELWALQSSYGQQSPTRRPLHGSAVGLAATSRQTINISDPASDSRFDKDVDQVAGEETSSALYVPVGSHGTSETSRPIAVLEIQNKQDEDSFTFDDECAFEAFASEVAVILRRRHNELKYIKLLADTRAEKVLAQRAKSQVNLLECYTSYPSIMGGTRDDDADDLFKAVQQASDGTTPSGGEETIQAVSSHPSDGEKQNATKLANFVQATRIPSWEFNVFDADVDSLPGLLEDMFLDLNLDVVLRTSRPVIRNFINAVREQYHPNPFHNFYHAFSVAHASYLMLTKTEAAEILQPLDKAACMIAALCHDVDHPGHTNAFEMHSSSHLAVLYSDDSILERHHASTTFRILMKTKDGNVLEHLSAPDYRHVRKMVINSILGTDMTSHFQFCQELEKVIRPTAPHLATESFANSRRESASSSQLDRLALDRTKSSTVIRGVLRGSVLQSSSNLVSNARGSCPSCLGEAKVERPQVTPSKKRVMRSGWVFHGSLEDRLFVVKTVVHASDLSGQVFEKPVALKWSNLIAKEFAFQALLERAENMPVTNEQLSDPTRMVDSQLFFAQKIVHPLWELMLTMFPDLQVCYDNLQTNIGHYEHELKRLQDKTLEKEDSDDSEEEGLAIAGVAKYSPAKFRSFRSKSASFDASQLQAYYDAHGQANEGMARSRFLSTVMSSGDSLIPSDSSTPGQVSDVETVEISNDDTSSSILDA